jgi:hypothetical protein
MIPTLLWLLAFSVPYVVQSIGTSDPYWFWINQHTTAPVRIWNRGSLTAVESIEGRSIRIKGTNRVVIVTPSQTNVRLAMVATGNDALEGIRLRLRTTDHDYIDRGQQGVTVVLDRQGVRMYDAQQVVCAATDTIHYVPGVPVRIAFEHDGEWTRIAIGCTLVGSIRTLLAATESTIVEPLGSSEGMLVLSDIAFEPVRP